MDATKNSHVKNAINEETTEQQGRVEPNAKSNEKRFDEDAFFADGEASDNESPVEKLARSLSSTESWSDGVFEGNSQSKRKKQGSSRKVKPYYDPMDTDANRKDWKNDNDDDEDDDEIVTPKEESTEEVNIVNVKKDFDVTAPTLPVMLLRLFRKSTIKEQKTVEPGEEAKSWQEKDQVQGKTTEQKSDENDRETVEQKNLEKSTDSKYSTEATTNKGDENATDDTHVETTESFATLLFRKLTFRQKPAEKKESTESQPIINYNGEVRTKYCPMCGKIWDECDSEEGRMIEKRAKDDLVFEGKLSDSKMWRAIWVQGDFELDHADSNGKIYRMEFRMDATGQPTFNESVTMAMNKNVEIGRMPGRF